MPLQQAPVPGAPPGVVQHDQIERRRVGRAVIGGVRDQLEVGQLAGAQLVHDLAGLGVTVVVAAGRLIAAQNVQRAIGEIRIDDGVLQGDDEAVAAEQADEPGHPGGRDEFQVVGALERQAQRRHVLHRLVEEAVDLFIGRLDFQRPAPPVLQSPGESGFQAVVDAFARRAPGRLAVAELIQKAGAPGLAGRELHVEADPAVGVDRRGPHPARPHRDLAFEVAVDIGRAQSRGLLGPFGVDPAPAHDGIGLHFEQVGEVAANGDLQIEPHHLIAVVHQLEVLVQALAQGAADHQAEAACGNGAGLRDEGPVDEEDLRRVVGDVAAVQQVPLFSVGVELPAGNHAGVRGVQPFVRRPSDLAVLLGDEDAVALIDRQARRADRDLDGHCGAWADPPPVLGMGNVMSRSAASAGRRGPAIARTGAVPPHPRRSRAALPARGRRRGTA